MKEFELLIAVGILTVVRIFCFFFREFSIFSFLINYRLAEENADAILDAKPPKKEKSNRKGDEIEETVTKSEWD